MTLLNVFVWTMIVSTILLIPDLFKITLVIAVVFLILLAKTLINVSRALNYAGLGIALAIERISRILG